MTRTEFYLLGCIIVFIYQLIRMYKDMPHKGYENLLDIVGWPMFIFISSSLSWVSVLIFIYIKIIDKWKK